MSTFNVGDKVVTVDAFVWKNFRTDEKTYNPWPKGTKGTVIKILSGGAHLTVKNEAGEIRSGISSTRFEKVEDAEPEEKPESTLPREGDRVYVAGVPGVPRYGAGWVTLVTEPNLNGMGRNIFSGKLEGDGSEWLFAVEDIIEPPVEDPEAPRPDHTKLVEKADALIGALTITQEQQYTVSVLRDLRDALVEASYR